MNDQRRPAGLFAGTVVDLFSATAPRGDVEVALVSELTDLIVDTVEPKVRADRHYRRKLEPCVRASVDWLRELGARPLQSLLLARGEWDGDRRLHAFFGRAEDIPALLGRSKDLRAFFGTRANRDATEAFALLGMRRQEKTLLAPRGAEGLVNEEVARTVVSFTGHRLVALAATQRQVRLEVGRRIMVRLAQVALGRILEIHREGMATEQRKDWLAARLRFLQLAQDGMEGLVEEPGTLARQVARARADLDKAVLEYVATRSTLATLDGYIRQIEEVFGRPREHVVLSHTPLRLDRMNVKVEAGADGDPAPLSLAELRVGDKLQAAVAFVCCPRAELPRRSGLQARADRLV